MSKTGNDFRRNMFLKNKGNMSTLTILYFTLGFKVMCNGNLVDKSVLI